MTGYAALRKFRFYRSHLWQISALGFLVREVLYLVWKAAPMKAHLDVCPSEI